MRTSKLAAICFMSLLFFSVAHAEDTTLAKPDVLGEETILTSQRLSKYSTLIIKDFDISNPAYENINDEEKNDIEPIKDSIPKVMTSKAINKLRGMNKFQKILTNSGAKSNAVILEGKVTKLSGGHGAAKFFLGFMAPQSAKTHIEISGRLIDATTGKVLAEFSDTKAGATGAAMGYLKEVLVNLAGDEGEELADFIAKLY